MIETRPAAILVLLASAAMLLAAFAFQYLGGLAPCPLCIWQRWPYGITIVLAALALPMRDGGRRGMLALCGMVFLVGAGIAFFHVGVEQGWWAGTAACGGTLPQARTVEELRAAIMRRPVVRCDEIAWSFLGISMAGWNILLSLALAALSFVAALKGLRRSGEWAKVRT